MIKLGIQINDIEQAAAILKKGGLVAFPTETVYGLGADAFNVEALARVFDVKRRPRFDPLIIHIGTLAGLERIADLDALDSAQRTLLNKLTVSFWPGPLTIVLPKRSLVPDLATAGLATAAIRFTALPAAQSLIECAGGAIAAPSANRFGHLSPTKAEHVISELCGLIDCVVDGGPCTIGVESTVVSICRNENSDCLLNILRPGGISKEQLEAVAGSMVNSTFKNTLTNDTDLAAQSPGLLKSHYAPDKPLCFFKAQEMFSLDFNQDHGYLFFSGKDRDRWLKQFAHTSAQSNIIALSESGNMIEAAANLFEFLRRLEAQEIKRINAQALPEQGIGVAVNDRLRRAAVV